MTAKALCTSFSNRLIRRVRRRILVGWGIFDLLLTTLALVLLDGGALNWAAALVRDRVLRAGAVSGTVATDRFLRRKIGLGRDTFGGGL